MQNLLKIRTYPRVSRNPVFCENISSQPANSAKEQVSLVGVSPRLFEIPNFFKKSRILSTRSFVWIAFSFFLLPSSFFLLPSSFFLLPSFFFLLPFFLLPSSFFLLPSSFGYNFNCKDCGLDLARQCKKYFH